MRVSAATDKLARTRALGVWSMGIVRNADGMPLVPVVPERKRAIDDDDGEATAGTGANAPRTEPDPVTRLLHSGGGGYDQALAEWDLQQACRYKPTVLSDRVRAIGLARNLFSLRNLVVVLRRLLFGLTTMSPI